ncbi:hypothetical protein DEU56DRAFT_755185 [Suillus clintonianus]|uniref:uncharacterized protein n=1 Tax=Suillus clintonianus TaxID=1904413 RepID=UPI001B876139|nr:uncharacterized protein DEU56DRAFT_755185 [Suillus clintonianus]KAG2140567.1 hypothetical protein DEU56DRAFT_755185 [Suillus clintonianus]
MAKAARWGFNVILMDMTKKWLTLHVALQGDDWPKEAGRGRNCSLSDTHCDSIHIPPVTHLPLNSSSSTTAGDILSKLPAVRHRAQSHSKDSGYSDSSRPTKRARHSTIHARSGPPGESPEPGSDRPHVANNNRNCGADDDCNRGARRLWLQLRCAQAAAPGQDPLHLDDGGEEEEEDEEEDEEDEEEEEEEEEAAAVDEMENEAEMEGDVCNVTRANTRRGSWHQHRYNDPKITCSDEAAMIIAEFASAYCNSTVHSPLSGLQDIANHVQTPCMEDKSLISVVVQCRGIASKDIHANFLVMINYMMLVYWHAIGRKFIALASGGSIYILVLISSLGLRVSVASMLTSCNRLLKFFDAIIQNVFVPLSRNACVWRPCIVPVPNKSNRVPVQSLNYDVFYGSSHPYSPPLSDVEEDETHHIVIKTLYDLFALKNKSFKAPRNKADNEIWSADERFLWAKLVNLYPKGVKRSQDTYLRIPMEIIPKPGLLEEADAQSPGCNHFQAMHLSWYNRHCTLGNEAPKEVQPWLLEKEGMRTN